MTKQVYQVLMVDDYDINLELLETYLLRSKLPVHILKAFNGRQAFQIIENNEVDLILLDVMLPDINGYDICKRLKNSLKYQGIPIIIITALSDKDSLFQGLQSGADEFLTKPVDGHELTIRVRNLLKLRQLMKTLSTRNHQLEQELKLASALQQTFLPTQTPNIPGYILDILYNPSIYIGGDFYDFLRIDDERLGIFIADVKGHGVASAMITATMKQNLYQQSHLWPQPTALLEALNIQLNNFFVTTNNDFFITAFYGIVNYNEHTLIYSNAGHCPPCLVTDTHLMNLDNHNGFPLGIFQHGSYELVSCDIPVGAELFLYTDGIFELNLFNSMQQPHLILTDLLEEPMLSVFSPFEKLSRVKQEIISAIENESSLPDDVHFIALKREAKEI